MTRASFILKYVLARAAIKSGGIDIELILKDANTAWEYANKGAIDEPK